VTKEQMEAAPISCALALQEMLIRHYGTAEEHADQVARYGLSDADLSCQIEADARDALASDPVMEAARKMREALEEARDAMVNTPDANRPYTLIDQAIGRVDAALSAASAAGIGDGE